MITLNGDPINVTMFPDKTSQVWKLNDLALRSGDASVVRWDFEHEGEVMQLAQLPLVKKMNQNLKKNLLVPQVMLLVKPLAPVLVE